MPRLRIQNGLTEVSSNFPSAAGLLFTSGTAHERDRTENTTQDFGYNAHDHVSSRLTQIQQSPENDGHDARQVFPSKPKECDDEGSPGSSTATSPLQNDYPPIQQEPDPPMPDENIDLFLRSAPLNDTSSLTVTAPLPPSNLMWQFNGPTTAGHYHRGEDVRDENMQDEGERSSSPDSVDTVIHYPTFIAPEPPLEQASSGDDPETSISTEHTTDTSPQDSEDPQEIDNDGDAGEEQEKEDTLPLDVKNL